ncbi:conserved hypothetical protein [Candidatus Roizmanbacteria bacterium]|nr:conserved hypothetical protein [Candidatus Roizmanbacteria bacterium]
MNLNISHIAGLCMDTLRLLNRPTVFLGVILFLAVLKVITVLLKTIFYERKLIIQKIPTTVLKLIGRHGLAGKVKIILDKKPLAFCLGFFRPKIYLSTGLIKLMNNQELEAIILHEKYHLLKKDNIFLVMANFLKQLFLPFPIIADFLDSSIKRREVKADYYGVILMGKKQPVVSAFKKLLNFDNKDSYLLNYSSAFTDGQHFENRIQALFGKKSLSFSFKQRNVLISLFSFIILSGFLFAPWQKTQANNQNQKPSVCLKNTDCNKHC